MTKDVKPASGQADSSTGWAEQAAEFLLKEYKKDTVIIASQDPLSETGTKTNKKQVLDSVLARPLDAQIGSKPGVQATAHPEQLGLNAHLSGPRLAAHLAAQLELGHTLLELSPSQTDELSSDPLCVKSPWYEQKLATGLSPEAWAFVPSRPVVLESGQAQFARQWQQEQQLSRVLVDLLLKPDQQADQLLEPVSKVHDAAQLQGLNEGQRQAVHTAIANRFCVITGGPGTGKTYTLAKLVGVLKARDAGVRIALAAPTGKAAQRMQESLEEAFSNYAVEPARTVHSLLGIRPASSPRYHSDRPLPYDLVVIDEASMLGLELTLKLLSACRGARVVLLGDANQLAAVEAGAVLHDLCQSEAIQPVRAHLTQSRRFSADSVIGQLAGFALEGEAEQLLAIKHEHFERELLTSAARLHGQLIGAYADFASQALKQDQVCIDQVEMRPSFDEFARVRVLGATRGGELGNQQINQALCAHFGAGAEWFTGRPLMVTRNQPELSLSNGDVGLTHVDDQGVVRVLFEHRTALLLNQLNLECLESAYAMTVHKSQGSEFDQVILVLAAASAEAESILSRELIYTAITRAKTKLTLYDQAGLLQQALSSNLKRQTALGAKLLRLLD